VNECPKRIPTKLPVPVLHRKAKYERTRCLSETRARSNDSRVAPIHPGAARILDNNRSPDPRHDVGGEQREAGRRKRGDKLCFQQSTGDSTGPQADLLSCVFRQLDARRHRAILRQFHVEGFVNQYVADLDSQLDKLVFTSEAIENIPPGWRARETYVFWDRMNSKRSLSSPSLETVRAAFACTVQAGFVTLLASRVSGACGDKARRWRT
jgi:hypothetical protein